MRGSFVLSTRGSAFTTIFLVSAGKGVLRCCHAVRQNRLISATPRRHDECPTRRTALPRASLVNGALRRGLRNVSRQISVRHMLRSMLQDTQAPPCAHRLLKDSYDIITVKFICQLRSIQTRPRVRNANKNALYGTFPLPTPFINAQGKVSRSSRRHSTLLNDDFRRQTTTNFLTRNRPTHRSIPLPLNTRHLFRDLRLRSSQEPTANGHRYTYRLSILRRLL